VQEPRSLLTPRIVCDVYSFRRLPKTRRTRKRRSKLTSQAQPRAHSNWLTLLSRFWPIIIGLGVISFPTWRYITQESWTTEQGSQGPLILGSGLWLLVKILATTKYLQSRPPASQAWPAIISMAVLLLLFRRAAVIELEVYALYGLCVALLFSVIGWQALKAAWFPVLYLGFAVPLPQSLVDAMTNPLKIWISDSSVSLLHMLGYPIASAGVTIQVGQYQLMVAAACAGLNSLITLSALTLFYVYLTHRAHWRYMLVLILAAIPVAIFANFVRVLMLILLTYHAGEAAAQGFLHNFAGMTTFAVALITIYVLDVALQKTLPLATNDDSNV